MQTEPTPIDSIITKYPGLGSLRQEDVLDLELVPVNESAGNTEITACNSYLMLGTLQLQLLTAKIPVNAFEPLFLEASRMRTEGSKYITGLRICFGMNKAFPARISPLFYALYMERTAQETASGDYTILNESRAYVFENSAFRLATTQELKWPANYTTSLKINRNNTGFTQWAEGDVKSLVFSFQTIYTLANDNEGTLDIYLYNSIRKALGTGEMIKHCILLSSKEMPFDNDLRGKYANRSHLCPPDCNILKYNVALFR